jgi:hypothetical protein
MAVCRGLGNKTQEILLLRFSECDSPFRLWSAAIRLELMGALLWSSHTVQNSCITPHRGYEFVKVLKERRDHPVLPNNPIHPINRRGRKNFCKEERKFKENPKINI